MSNERSVVVTLPVVSMGSLRQTLFETLRELKSGKIKSQDAIAIAKVANTILESAKVQIEFEKLRVMYPQTTERLPEMPLADTGT
jgi:hypothetical protein